MTSPTSKKRICVGKIASAHGVKGLVKILPYCEDLYLLEGELFTSDKDAHKDTIKITLKNRTSKYILAAIDGITTPEEAKKLKCSLYISRDTLPEINNEDEFYIEDLIGLQAISHDHGDILGTVKAVDNFGAGDLLEIAPIDNTTPYYVPFHDDYVSSVDLKNTSVTLKNTEIFRIG
ncbi:MAG: ribosome maturation factor RimM [Alphaproteobacteria bacterium]